jgi:ADP-ribose pyrophosphatase
MKKLKENHYSFSHKPTGYKKKVIRRIYELPNGKPWEAWIDDTPDSVIVFPMTENGQVVLVKQFRPGSEREELEFPGGMIDPGEKAIRAAERELLEETGYQGNIEFICAKNYSPYSAGRKHIFLATNCKQITKHLDLDPNEFLEVAIIDIEDLENLLYDSKIRNPDVAYMALHHLGLLKIRI